MIEKIAKYVGADISNDLIRQGYVFVYTMTGGKKLAFQFSGTAANIT